MNTLMHKHCQPIPTGATALSLAAINPLLENIPEWKINPSATVISRVFHFKNYFETIAFVNTIAWVAHREDHHPELEVSYNHCKVSFNTHTVNGLSENDFICAEKIDYLLL